MGHRANTRTGTHCSYAMIFFETSEAYATFEWIFHEAGHGKGAPDGVGAVLKRRADRFASHGHSIHNARDFMHAVQDCDITVGIVSGEDVKRHEDRLMSNDHSILPVPQMIFLQMFHPKYARRHKWTRGYSKLRWKNEAGAYLLRLSTKNPTHSSDGRSHGAWKLTDHTYLENNWLEDCSVDLTCEQRTQMTGKQSGSEELRHRKSAEELTRRVGRDATLRLHQHCECVINSDVDYVTKWINVSSTSVFEKLYTYHFSCHAQRISWKFFGFNS